MYVHSLLQFPATHLDQLQNLLRTLVNSLLSVPHLDQLHPSGLCASVSGRCGGVVGLVLRGGFEAKKQVMDCAQRPAVPLPTFSPPSPQPSAVRGCREVECMCVCV